MSSGRNICDIPRENTPKQRKIWIVFFCRMGFIGTITLSYNLWKIKKKFFLTLKDVLKFEWSASIRYYAMPYIKLGSFIDLIIITLQPRIAYIRNEKCKLTWAILLNTIFEDNRAYLIVSTVFVVKILNKIGYICHRP